MKRQSGFTLLEAVVAMVLISGAGAALFSWINSELGSVSRLQQSNARAEAMVNAMEFMHTVNPMLTPEGKASFAAYRLTWKAEEITQVQDGLSYPRGISLYQLALYDTPVRVINPDGTPWFDFTLRQVGYKRVRDNKPQ
jgi:general secretion pathway protein I